MLAARLLLVFQQGDGGGNAPFAADGAKVVAQEKVKKRLAEGTTNALTGNKTPPAAPEALPAQTYGDRLVLKVKGRSAALGAHGGQGLFEQGLAGQGIVRSGQAGRLHAVPALLGGRCGGRRVLIEELAGSIEDGAPVAVRGLVALHRSQFVRTQALEPADHLGGREGVVAGQGPLDQIGVRWVRCGLGRNCDQLLWKAALRRCTEAA